MASNMKSKTKTADKDHVDKKEGIRWIYKRLKQTRDAADIYHKIMHVDPEGAKDLQIKRKNDFL